MLTCAQHPEGAARWHCGDCQQSFCDECIVADMRGATRFERCKVCRQALTPIAASVHAPPFGDAVCDAFAYPLRGDGALILVMGAAVAGLGGAFHVLLGLIGLSLLLGYGMSVLQATMDGHNDAPEWPEMDDPWTLLKPLGVAGVATLVAFWPALHYRGTSLPVAIGFLLAGWLYLPGAWIAASLSRSFRALHPLCVLPLIAVLGARYWAAVALVTLLEILDYAAEFALEVALPGPLGSVAQTGVFFYLLIVGMRILGLACIAKRTELGWD